MFIGNITKNERMLKKGNEDKVERRKVVGKKEMR